MAHYLFNFVKRGASEGPVLREEAARLLRVRMWGVDAGERHRDALASGDLILIYLGAPRREFIGRAELASTGVRGTSQRPPKGRTSPSPRLSKLPPRALPSAAARRQPREHSSAQPS